MREGPPGATFTVELLASRVWADHEVHPSYAHEFQTLASDGSGASTLRRTDEHLRLVSNARPAGQTGLPGDYEYDDEACGQQSIYVQPGDWITAVLKVDGARACAIELPVERPWSEANLPHGPGPVSIATTAIDWIAIGGATPHPDNPSWTEVAAFHTQRMSEDWAQAGIRGEVSSVSQGTPVSNLMFLPASPATYVPGTILVHAESLTTSLCTAVVEVTAAHTPESLAHDIAQGLTLEGVPCTARRFLTPIHEHGYTIKANGTLDVYFVFTAGTTNVALRTDPLNWDNDVLSPLEAESLGLNYKPGLGASQTRPAVFILRETRLMDGDLNISGFCLVTNQGTVDPDDYPGMARTILLVNSAGDGWDGDNPRTVGHEFGHFLMDTGDHPSSSALLMYVAGPPPATPAESPGFGKRLRNTEITKARTHGSAFLELPCIPIPNPQ